MSWCLHFQAHRSHRRRLDWPLRLLGMRPYRCSQCGQRFWRRGAGKRELPAVKSEQLKRWFAVLLYVVLLLPVPAYAFTWVTGSNWAITGGSTTQNVNTTLNTGYGEVSGEPAWLFIQPTTTSNTATQITLQRDFLPGSGNPSMTANELLSNFTVDTGGSVKIAVWTTDPSNNVVNIIGATNTNPLVINGTTGQYLNNQFGTGSSSLSTGTDYTLHVYFNINSTSWTTLSTNTRLVSEFAD